MITIENETRNCAMLYIKRSFEVGSPENEFDFFKKETGTLFSGESIQCIKSGRLRKFKGYGKKENLKPERLTNDDRIEAYKKRLKEGESREVILLSIAEKELKIEPSLELPSKKNKVKSPDWGFAELVEDNMRKENYKLYQDLESLWVNSNEETDDNPLSDCQLNYKLLFCSGMVAVFTLVALTISLLHQSDFMLPSNQLIATNLIDLNERNRVSADNNKQNSNISKQRSKNLRLAQEFRETKISGNSLLDLGRIVRLQSSAAERTITKQKYTQFNSYVSTSHELPLNRTILNTWGGGNF